jgi:hypothetical protein
METKVHVATEKIRAQSILQPEGFFLQDNDRPLISEDEGFSALCVDCIVNGNIEFETYNPGSHYTEVRLKIGGHGITGDRAVRLFGAAIKRSLERTTRSSNLPSFILAPSLNEVVAGTGYTCPIDFLKSKEVELIGPMMDSACRPQKCTNQRQNKTLRILVFL